MMPSCAAASSGLTWLTTSGTSGLHPPGVRVVDHDRAALSGFRRELVRDVPPPAEKSAMSTPLEGVRRGLADRRWRPPYRWSGRPAGPTRAGGLADRELALDEHLDHRLADDAGGANYRDGERAAVGGVRHRGHSSARPCPCRPSGGPLVADFRAAPGAGPAGSPVSSPPRDLGGRGRAATGAAGRCAARTAVGASRPGRRRPPPPLAVFRGASIHGPGDSAICLPQRH